MVSATRLLIDPEQLKRYRARTFRLVEPLRTQEETRAFVNERGFVYLWPINNAPCPSLWQAVAGERPVASSHDDTGHVTWRWKDEALGKRFWYYAKVLRGKATLIALDAVPAFYALSENYGDWENDYLQRYQDGLLSRAAKLIYETLLTAGPLDTVTLKRRTQMTGKAHKSAFERGLTELQRDFKVLPVGLSQSGAWRYSFIYDLVPRHYPELPESARAYSRKAARTYIVRRYFASLGAARMVDLQRLFQWRSTEIERTVSTLVEAGELLTGCHVRGNQDSFYARPELLEVSTFGR